MWHECSYMYALSKYKYTWIIGYRSMPHMNNMASYMNIPPPNAHTHNIYFDSQMTNKVYPQNSNIINQ